MVKIEVSKKYSGDVGERGVDYIANKEECNDIQCFLRYLRLTELKDIAEKALMALMAELVDTRQR